MSKSELYESDKIFKELIDHISSGVAIYETVDNGETFIIREINNAGLRICETTREVVIGKNLSDVFPGVEEFGFLNGLRRVWKTGKSENRPTSFYRDDRVNGWTELYIYKLPSGKVATIFERKSELLEAKEIINQKKIEDELQKSEIEKLAILESLLEHIVYQAPDNTIIWVNKAAADSVNSTPDHLIGRKCYKVWNDLEHPCPGCPIVKSLNSKKPEINEMTTPDGRMWRVAGYPVIDKDNNIIGVVESTLDITEKKIAEEKYRKAFNQANLYRDIFAHDINNMLQNIQSSAELSSLYLNNPEKLQTLKELSDIIIEQIERGKKLITNVRKITQIDESEVKLEKINAARLLKNAVEYLRNSFQARTIDVNINPSTEKFFVMANNLLLDVFENILINAVRHNNKAIIKINIDISRDLLDNIDYIKMQFKDNAIGISDYRKKIIFEKGKRKSQKSKGMGLGLSLVKKIIESYNGDIKIEDRVKGDYKQGSNFIILLQEAK